MRQNIAMLAALAVLCSACGGGDGGSSTQVVTPVEQSLVGSYSSTTWDRDGVTQGVLSLEMEIGNTQIRITGSTNPGDMFILSTVCTYTASNGGLLARSPGTAVYGFSYHGAGTQLRTWHQALMSDVTTTVYWTKTSDSTTLH